MPWCPVCKNEYKDGYTECSDCGSKLVESLSEVVIPIYFTEDESVIDGLLSFLASNSYDKCEKRVTEDEVSFELWCPKDDANSVSSMMRVYFKEFVVSAESDEEIEDSSVLDDNSDSVNEDVINRYKDSSERAEEYKAGAIVLLLVGIVGLCALLLISLGVININFTSVSLYMVDIVMGLLFLIFICMGASSFGSYIKLRKKGVDDNELKARVLKWSEDNLTKDIVCANDLEANEDEANYFSRVQIISDAIKASHTDIDDSFLEYISEEVYNKLFD